MPPALHDPILVVVSFAVVTVIVLAARWSSSLNVPPSGVRRLVHALVGLWTAFVTGRFHDLSWALVPPVGFLLLNASGKTARLAPRLERPDEPGSARGLWTFPLGVILTYLVFWNDRSRAPVIAGCLALALADPAAAWIGSRYGQRRLHPIGAPRTIEGSLTFLLVAAVTTGVLAARFGAPPVTAVRLAVGCAAAGALVEAVAPRGWDNAAIPVAVAAAYHFLA